MAYIIMLVFQLVGALILLINTVNGSKQKVISNCFPGSNVVTRDDENNTVISKEQLQNSANQIYLNIVAFADLLIGYIVAAFSPIAFTETHATVFAVVISSILLAVAECYAVKKIARRIYSEDEIIPYDDLEKIGVDTFVTNKEIEALFEESDMK